MHVCVTVIAASPLGESTKRESDSTVQLILQHTHRLLLALLVKQSVGGGWC